MPVNKNFQFAADSIISGSGMQISGLLTVQNTGKTPFFILATVGNTPPTEMGSGIKVFPGPAMAGYTLSEMFPGLMGADHLWFYSPNEMGQGFLSHA